MKKQIFTWVLAAGFLAVSGSSIVLGQENPPARPGPLPKHNFLVEISNLETEGFEKVEGLACGTDVVTYREGNSQDTTPAEYPGLTDCGPVTLERAVTGDDTLWEWYEATKDGDADVRNAFVHVLDRARNARATYHLLNAWPMRYEVSHLDAGESDVAMERIVLAVEDMDFLGTGE